jgi:tetratricopeptide (TPR) repeat protein
MRVRVAGLVLSVAYGVLIVWVYANQPRTLAQLTGGVASTVGAYRIDQAAFDDGLKFFHADKFEEARAAFGRADPARQDATAQFYIAYAYYRQGWGRLYNDAQLFRKGLEAIDHAISVAPTHRIEVADQGLGMRTADEVRAELQRGLTRDASDLNPLRVLDTRK